MDQAKLIAIIENAAREGAERLVLSHKGITQLPEQIGQLVHLRTLDLRDNQLTTLPEQIGVLPKLSELWLARNEFTTLPEPIRQLSTLRWLTVEGNHLERLPRWIGELKQLRELFLGLKLHGNPLVDLPLEIRDLNNLRDLRVSNCPHLNLPPEIVAKRNSPQEILDYYFRSREQPARPLSEAKVLVVGEAEVGKTSLIKRLMGRDFDPNEDQTHGIVTHRWDLEVRRGAGFQPAKSGGVGLQPAKDHPEARQVENLPHDRSVRLNVWDFGGQEIMHATHQFFLTKRSLYLLVLDSRHNERQSRIEYWLKLIHSFGEDSPVIVVCNKCDQQQMQLDWKGLKAKYPQIRRYVKAVSCADGSGLKDVVRGIRHEIARLAHVDSPFLETWFGVKEQLEAMSDSYIPYTDYTEQCRQGGITEEKEQRQLIEFLHDLGIVLHFHDHPILRDLNILNPLWVTTAVYRILTCRELSAARGVLTFGELGTLLDKVAEERFSYPPERQTFVIEMMRRFELLFDFEGQINKKFLVPGLLPLEQPEGVDDDWDDALGFCFQYEVLPQSVISRFIVRMHQRICEELYWRKGVVLKSQDGDAQARVKADLEDARIDVSIRGQPTGRRRFLQSIRDQLDGIHATIPRLAVVEQVPLPDHPGVLVPYSRLLKFEHSGLSVDRVEVGEELVEIDVKELLEGIRHPAGLDVFISYAHADLKWLDRFNTILSPMVRDGRITTWSDADISASHLWREEIDRALRMVRSGLLLISPGFLASEFIMRHEVPYLLRAREEGRTRIIIAVLSDCLWQETPLGEIQAAHDPKKPLDGLKPAQRSQVITSICRKLVWR